MVLKMVYKQELESELAVLIDSYDKTTNEVKTTHKQLKALKKQQRELKREILYKLQKYRKFI